MRDIKKLNWNLIEAAPRKCDATKGFIQGLTLAWDIAGAIFLPPYDGLTPDENMEIKKILNISWCDPILRQDIFEVIKALRIFKQDSDRKEKERKETDLINITMKMNENNITLEELTAYIKEGKID